jgi:segregation and condensation protein A
MAPSDSAAAASSAGELLLHLEGFDGPLDLLLDLARSQKVDLARISILSLVDQYIQVIEGARRISLELAADWLVMAAWLTWLKSRLLLPADTAEAEEGEQAADVLAARLRDLQAMRAGAAWIGARLQLGQDVFARGAPESLTETDRSRLALDVTGLIRAYLAALRRAGAQNQYKPATVTFWTVQDALRRVGSLLGSIPDWSALEYFLPFGLHNPTQRRAAMASTLLAGLELARDGTLRLRQEAAFGPILIAKGETM